MNFQISYPLGQQKTSVDFPKILHFYYPHQDTTIPAITLQDSNFHFSIAPFAAACFLIAKHTIKASVCLQAFSPSLLRRSHLLRLHTSTGRSLSPSACRSWTLIPSSMSLGMHVALIYQWLFGTLYTLICAAPLKHDLSRICSDDKYIEWVQQLRILKLFDSLLCLYCKLAQWPAQKAGGWHSFNDCYN